MTCRTATGGSHGFGATEPLMEFVLLLLICAASDDVA
jgi:hypothetical protein